MSYLERWRLLVAAIVLLAGVGCQPQTPAAPVGPAATQPPAAKPAVADWQANWERSVSAARQEGRVVIASNPGDSFRNALTAMQETYPDIKIEFTGVPAPEFVAKVARERESGLYLWDIFAGGIPQAVRNLVPAGVADPLRPSLIRPEMRDDSKWLNGFEAGFMDKQRERVYTAMAYTSAFVFVNREVIPEGEFTKLSDLLDPRYKGKITWEDPTFGTTGSLVAALVKRRLGEDKLRKILKEQDVVVTRDPRQLTEWVVRGRYPIAMGARSELDAMQRQGVGKHVSSLDIEEATVLSSWFGVTLINQAPHPNAAKVFLDWFLSQEGQAKWNKYTPFNSRRLDIEPANPATLPKPGVQYFSIDREEDQHLREDAISISKEVLP